MIKKAVALISSLLISISSAIVCNADDKVQNINTHIPPRTLYLGDSIATGHGLENYETGRENCESYANILYKKYKSTLDGKCKTDIKNMAIDGQTSSELLSDIQNGKYDDVLSNTDCIIISIGGNDLLKTLFDILNKSGITNRENIKNEDLSKIVSMLKDFNSTIDNKLEQFDKNIKEISELICSQTDAEVIIQTLYNPFEGFDKIPALSIIASDKIGKLNDIINNYSDSNNTQYTVCDIASAFSGKANELTRISQWDIHPNEDGHKVIADTLDKTIQSKTFTYSEIIKSDVNKDTDNTENNKTLKLPAALIAISAVTVAIVTFVFIRYNNKKKKGNDQ